MADPVFKSINRKTANFLIWRIENMNVVAVPKTSYGSFYKGDSYIILSIVDKKGSMEANIHFWLGKETTQDEAGVAAFKSVELDDHLGGFPIQHREVQECESKLFLSYFKKGIKYVNGGAKSGFNHVDQTHKPRLLQVKGKQHPRIIEVDMAWASFNSGDVFILDLGNVIFVWLGKDSSRTEKFKAFEQARFYRDDRGKANIVEVNEEKQLKDLSDTEAKLWDKYLPISEMNIKSSEEGGSDETTEKAVSGGLKLYCCSEEEGTLKVKEVKSGPLEKNDLDTGDSYIIQNGSQAIWVWTGKQSSKKEKSEAMRNALGFIRKKGLPNSVNVTRVVEGGEPPDFICLFKKWPKPQATGKVWNNNKIAKTVQTKFDAATLHSNTSLAAETKMVDDGTGTTEVWRVNAFDLEPLKQNLIGEFYGGDCYVIKYTYKVNNKDNYIIYYWQGLKSTSDEKGTSALKAVEKDDEVGGAAVQIRVVHGKEPNHFMSMFDGKMRVFSGGHAGWKQQGDDGPGDSYMLQVRGTNEFNTKSVQVPLEAASLNSNDVFFVKTPKINYLWFGKGSTGDERAVSKVVAGALSNMDTTIVTEGQEKKAFWDAIGGQGEYNSSKRLQDDTVDLPARLFQISNASGTFQVEDIPEFAQSDCCTDDCMMLDAGDTIFVWIGEDARPEEKKEAERIALDYLKNDPRERDVDTTVCRIKQGYEPPTFTGFFHAWDRDYFKKSQGYEQFSKDLAAENNEVIAITEQTENGGDSFNTVAKYTLAQLQASPEDLPGDIDAAMKEMYLSADDFQEQFGMPYTEFMQKPQWKQQSLKKKCGLF